MVNSKFIIFDDCNEVLPSIFPLHVREGSRSKKDVRIMANDNTRSATIDFEKRKIYVSDCAADWQVI